MGMSFIGSYSGIDQSAIDQLMQAERIPLNKMTKQKTSINEKKDAWKDVNTRLNSLFEKMKALKTTSSFNTKIAKSSDENFVTMEAGNSAAEGRYDIRIKQLATNTSIVGKQVGNNELSFNAGEKLIIGNKEGKSTEIDLEGVKSLKEVAEKINLATKDSKDSEGKTLEGTGISATVIDGRLVLNDGKSGARDINIDANAATLTGLGLDVSTEIDGEGAGIKPGSQAEFTLNGITINSDTNRVTGVVDGIVINLNRTHDPENTADYETINITSDTEKAAQAVQDFVDQYNSTIKFIDEKTKAGDPEVEGSRGVLSGESSLTRLQTSLRQMVTSGLSVEGSTIKNASEIGISTFDKSGELRFDKDKFLEELGKDKDNVINFLNPKNVDGNKTGLVDKVNGYIDGFISKSDGIIKGKNDSFDKTLRDISDRIERFEDRIARKEEYYVKMFTALDVAMMKAEEQMSWLAGQVQSMNGGK